MYSMKTIFYLFSFLLLVACGGAEQKLQLVPEVNIVAVGQYDIPVFSEYVGQVLGQSDIALRPRVEGWITAIHFKEGDNVKQGDLLYTIEDIQLQNNVASAQAKLTEAEAMYQKAKSDLDRIEPLVAANALSQRDLDAARAYYQAQKENVNSATAMKSNAQIEQGYSRITAPISGIIGISKVQVGDYVSRSFADNSINTISATASVRVRFSITENEFLTFKKRREAKGPTKDSIEISLLLSDGTLYPEIGKVDFADRSIDPQTGTLMIQAIFKNDSKLLRPGQYVKVRFKSDEMKQAIVIPQQAINQLQSVFRVFVLNDSNQIIPRMVKVGPRNGSNWVIAEGLNASDKVAVLGNAIVKPKMVIKPVNMPWNYDSTLVK
jgi:membrane fusion protein (multidrug efflux system)